MRKLTYIVVRSVWESVCVPMAHTLRPPQLNGGYNVAHMQLVARLRPLAVCSLWRKCTNLRPTAWIIVEDPARRSPAGFATTWQVLLNLEPAQQREPSQSVVLQQPGLLSNQHRPQRGE